MRSRPHHDDVAACRPHAHAVPFRLAEAAVEHPDDTVRAALFPVVGEKTLRGLVREAKTNQRVYPGSGAHRRLQGVPAEPAGGDVLLPGWHR